MADAKKGDGAARNWLARYLLGEPQAQAPTPTTLAVEELLCDDIIGKVVAKKQQWRELGFYDDEVLAKAR